MQLTEAMAKLESLYMATPQPLLTEALLFCAQGRVAQATVGTYTVHNDTDSDDPDIATVEGGACDCDPLAETRQVCAHVLAVELYELLGKAPKQGPLDGPLLERHVEKLVSGAVMAEAPYSVNLTVEDADGYNLMFTVRKQDGKEFFEAVTGLRSWAKKQGFVPKQWKAPAPTQEQQQAPSPAPRDSDERPRGNVLRFHAETLVRNELDGRILWAVKGPDMPRYNVKFGMRCWPEVLDAAGFDTKALETVRSTELPSLQGWIAEYVNKAGEDKPDKVTFLSKGDVSI